MSVACCTTSCHLIVFCLFAHVLITLIFLCAPVVVYIHFASVFIVTCLSHRKCYQQNAVVTKLLYDMVVGVVSGDVVLSVSWRMRPVSLAHSYVTGIGRFSSLDYTISFPANREGGVVYKDSDAISHSADAWIEAFYFSDICFQLHCVHSSLADETVGVLLSQDVWQLIIDLCS